MSKITHVGVNRTCGTSCRCWNCRSRWSRLVLENVAHSFSDIVVRTNTAFDLRTDTLPSHIYCGIQLRVVQLVGETVSQCVELLDGWVSTAHYFCIIVSGSKHGLFICRKFWCSRLVLGPVSDFIKSWNLGVSEVVVRSLQLVEHATLLNKRTRGTIKILVGLSLESLLADNFVAG